jgi:hypothetical protein
VPAAGEVVVAVQQAGLGGTDVHVHDGHDAAAFPVILGHEIVGAVAGLGDGVTRFAVGDQVSINPNLACGTCPFGQAGRTTQCRHLVGLGTLRDVFFAHHGCVPDDSENAEAEPGGVARDTTSRDADADDQATDAQHDAAQDETADGPGKRYEPIAPTIATPRSARSAWWKAAPTP